MVNIRDIETYRENNQLEAKKALAACREAYGKPLIICEH